MKRILILAITALPLLTFAQGTDKKEKDKKIEININTNENGTVEITGLSSKELKEIAKQINNALKSVTIKIDDGKEKHQVHFKAEIKTE